MILLLVVDLGLSSYIETAEVSHDGQRREFTESGSQHSHSSPQTHICIEAYRLKLTKE
jgi:hypothetical protein